MLKPLKFVMGGVSRKDMVPEMKHFAIEGGRVRSYNGTIALSSPLPFDIDCYPKADMLYKAIANCEETVQLSLTPAGKLKIVSGAFKALVSCVENTGVHLEPSGELVEVDGEVLLKAFKTVEPFIGDDASRPWANGVLLRGHSAFATCNVVLVEYWMGLTLPYAVNVPASAVREVIRVNEPPARLQMDKDSITFHFDDGRWIRTQLFSTEWPDVSRILDKQCNATPVDNRIFDAVAKLKHFADKTGRMIFMPNVVATHEDDNEEGGRIELPGSRMQGIYSYDMLMLLKGVAAQADFEVNPCIFYGERLRGAIRPRSM